MPKPKKDKILFVIAKGEARRFFQEDDSQVWFVNLDGKNALIIYIKTGRVEKLCVDKRQDFGEQIPKTALDEHARVQIDAIDHFIEPRKNGSLAIGYRWKTIGLQG